MLTTIHNKTGVNVNRRRVMTGAFALAFLSPTRSAGSKPSLAAPRIRTVSEFGAAGDGVHDDSAALQSALEQSDILHFDGGVHLCANLRIPPHRALVGTGVLRLKVSLPNDLSPLLRLTGPHIAISGLSFEGNRAFQPTDRFADAWDTGPSGSGKANRAAILGDGAVDLIDDIAIANCAFREFWGACIALRNAANVRVEGNTFERTNFEAVFAYTLGHRRNKNLSIRANRCLQIGSGHPTVNANAFLVSGCDGFVVGDNQAQDLERNLVKMEGCSDGLVVRNVLRRNSSASFSGIQIQSGGRSIRISNNTLVEVQKGIHIEKGDIRDISIEGNLIKGVVANATPDAMAIIGARNVLIAHNVCSGVGRNGVVLQDVQNLVIRNSFFVHEERSQLSSAGVSLRGELESVDIEESHFAGFDIGIDGLKFSNRNPHGLQVRLRRNEFISRSAIAAGA